MIPVLAGSPGDTDAPVLRTGEEARVAVLRAGLQTPAVPAVALLLAGLPRVFRASESTVRPLPARDPLCPYVLARVEVGACRALIPDLDAIEVTLADVHGAGNPEH